MKSPSQFRKIPFTSELFVSHFPSNYTDLSSEPISLFTIPDNLQPISAEPIIPVGERSDSDQTSANQRRLVTAVASPGRRLKKIVRTRVIMGSRLAGRPNRARGVAEGPRKVEVRFTSEALETPIKGYLDAEQGERVVLVLCFKRRKHAEPQMILEASAKARRWRCVVMEQFLREPVDDRACYFFVGKLKAFRGEPAPFMRVRKGGRWFFAYGAGVGAGVVGGNGVGVVNSAGGIGLNAGGLEEMGLVLWRDKIGALAEAVARFSRVFVSTSESRWLGRLTDSPNETAVSEVCALAAAGFESFACDLPAFLLRNDERLFSDAHAARSLVAALEKQPPPPPAAPAVPPEGGDKVNPTQPAIDPNVLDPTRLLPPADPSQATEKVEVGRPSASAIPFFPSAPPTISLTHPSLLSTIFTDLFTTGIPPLIEQGCPLFVRLTRTIFSTPLPPSVLNQRFVCYFSLKGLSMKPERLAPSRGLFNAIFRLEQAKSLKPPPGVFNLKVKVVFRRDDLLDFGCLFDPGSSVHPILSDGQLIIPHLYPYKLVSSKATRFGASLYLSIPPRAPLGPGLFFSTSLRRRLGPSMNDQLLAQLLGAPQLSVTEFCPPRLGGDGVLLAAAARAIGKIKAKVEEKSRKDKMEVVARVERKVERFLEKRGRLLKVEQGKPLPPRAASADMLAAFLAPATGEEKDQNTVSKVSKPAEGSSSEGLSASVTGGGGSGVQLDLLISAQSTLFSTSFCPPRSDSSRLRRTVGEFLSPLRRIDSLYIVCSGFSKDPENHTVFQLSDSLYSISSLPPPSSIHFDLSFNDHSMFLLNLLASSPQLFSECKVLSLELKGVSLTDRLFDFFPKIKQMPQLTSLKLNFSKVAAFDISLLNSVKASLDLAEYSQELIIKVKKTKLQSHQITSFIQSHQLEFLALKIIAQPSIRL